MLTEIWRINDNGSIEYVACYSIDPKSALIAFKQQQKRNFNTWGYPKDDPDIKRTPKGEYVYFEGENTSVFTKTQLVM